MPIEVSDTLPMESWVQSEPYIRCQENAMLYASAPARVLLGGLAGLRFLMDRAKGKPRSRNSSALMVTLLYDGIGGLVLALWLGTISGRAPGFAKD
jgi:hypothetical protein